jgi:chromosome segregation protein
VQFNRLRLSGFKSFVDPTELVIEQGLTGIVGPNGCGKSNLLEALKWVMGETSAKSIRGTEMDDVIFAGTSSRPARNLAEVSLVLDNGDRRLPAQFNDKLEVEISRRIERESGSAYRVNGREVRAKDVQLMFADQGTGARSPALVSQNRVSAIINAKPADRRAILEEAAGIGGLYTRRHEAELRLRAAETNLTRLDDVMGQLDAQVQALKRQSRQATRYRNLSGHIRRTEALVLHLRWVEAERHVAEAAERLTAAEAEVARLTAEAAAATIAEAEAAERLPALRQAEAEAAAALHRLEVERDSLMAEERRVAEAQRKAEAMLAELARDAERETVLAADAKEALARLGAEREGLEAARAGQAEADAAADAALNEAAQAVRAIEAELDRVGREIAALDGRRQAIAREREDLGRRIARLNDTAAQVAAERGRIEAEKARAAALADATAAVEAARAEVEAAKAALDEAIAARPAAQGSEAEARQAASELEAQATRLKAEADGLAALLGRDARKFPPLIDQVGVPPGLETALGAAFGDDLDLPTATEAPAHWAALPPYDAVEPLPDGVERLAPYVKAPAALARRLEGIGLVASPADGHRLHGLLKPGQCLVSRQGDVWRWDGFTAAADAPSRAAQRLAQRNRLAELEAARAALDGQLAAARADLEAARQNAKLAAERETERRTLWNRAEEQLSRAREAEARATREAAAREARLASLAETEARVAQERRDAEAALANAEAAIAALPPRAELENERGRFARDVEQARGNLAQTRAARDGLRREALARAQRLDSIAAEMRAWAGRAEHAERRLADVAERRAAALREKEELADQPSRLAQLRERLGDAIEAGAESRRSAADALAEGETALAAARSAVKAVETSLGQAREERVRAESYGEQSAERRRDVAQRIAEVLDVGPAEVLPLAELEEGEEVPEAAVLETKLERLKRERENMGPVNLRADVEATEKEAELTNLTTEREDLIAAIAKLRAAIGTLNREGRERLLTALEETNAHFAELFERLFGGGRAHLTLVESDDPLEAGLEIMASPPGKKLQSLGLLSGGEQALTAIALIFAVFLTNPSPICVLDEVDAPLDDANINRFCDLLDVMSRRGETRFLVVTHHAVTMSRMDRLFGVTMAEAGVSQLVSVDLVRTPQLKAAE